MIRKFQYLSDESTQMDFGDLRIKPGETIVEYKNRIHDEVCQHEEVFSIGVRGGSKPTVIIIVKEDGQVEKLQQKYPDTLVEKMKRFVVSKRCEDVYEKIKKTEETSNSIIEFVNKHHPLLNDISNP